jgi:hypothetical protein
MTLTTTEVLSVDGVDLNTLGYNVTTLTGRESLPPRRGDNVEIAYKQGRIWTPKSYDQRRETWSMFVIGADEDGLVPAVGARAQFNDNLRMLKQLFGVRQRQLVLQKKILTGSGLVTLTAEAECVGTLDPTIMAGGTRAVFSADLLFADPFWYRTQESETFSSAGMTITHPGTIEATKMTIRLDGPLTDPRIRNTTRSPNAELRYTGTIAGGDYVTIDTDQFTAVLHSTGANVVGKVANSGSVWWMELLAGANVMTLDRHSGGAVGAGTVTIDYLPPEL